MDNFKISSDIILVIFLGSFMVMITAIIFYKIRKERKQKIENRQDIHLKKRSILPADIKELEAPDKNENNRGQSRSYQLVSNTQLKGKLESDKIDPSSKKEKILVRYKRYLGVGFMKREKDENQSEIQWR